MFGTILPAGAGVFIGRKSVALLLDDERTGA